ncbi:type II toxin-antitoxin system Phd/YefM family antitoxin [Haloferula sp.]|uniref:type II toxin-antitoxin system Phd/YefM family antitoxin n=1 Tax=Haloferula sp. TaxID=2497595 RepID=UPI003C77D81F
METSNIATAKSQFSRLIDLVKQGQTVLITERNKPVAMLQPLVGSSNASLDALFASGLLAPPGKALDLAKFLSAPRASLAPESSLTRAIIEEREEGR